MYDAYAPMAARAGAVVVPVKLDPQDWSIPHVALEEAFSHRTKLILINTPHNPTGKVIHPSPIVSPVATANFMPTAVRSFLQDDILVEHMIQKSDQ